MVEVDGSNANTINSTSTGTRFVVDDGTGTIAVVPPAGGAVTVLPEKGSSSCPRTVVPTSPPVSAQVFSSSHPWMQGIARPKSLAFRCEEEVVGGKEELAIEELVRATGGTTCCTTTLRRPQHRQRLMQSCHSI